VLLGLIRRAFTGGLATMRWWLIGDDVSWLVDKNSEA